MEKSTQAKNQMMNYYELFEIPFSASSKQIIMAYENKITKFNNLMKLSQEQVNEIKLLKVGLFILINEKLRNNYNRVIGLKKHETKSHEFVSSEPVAGNSNLQDSLDSLFSVDNSWMKNQETNKSDTGRKGRNEINMIGDRVFSLSEFNKRPGFSSDFETELRKPQQGRIDKSDEKINKD